MAGERWLVNDDLLAQSGFGDVDGEVVEARQIARDERGDDTDGSGLAKEARAEVISGSGNLAPV